MPKRCPVYHTEKVNKKFLSWKDDKRYLLTEEQAKKLNKKPTDTLAWEHKAIRDLVSK